MIAGILPDGEYSSNTKIWFCCRNDGSPANPLKLPSSAPFYLFKVGEECQQVCVSQIAAYLSDKMYLAFQMVSVKAHGPLVSSAEALRRADVHRPIVRTLHS